MSPLVLTIIRSIGAAIAPSTRADYNKVWNDFNAFAVTLFPGCVVLPANPVLILFYLAFLDFKNFSPSTITSKLSAISFIHRLYCQTDPGKHYLIEKFLLGLKKLKPQTDHRDPVSLQDLHCLVSAISFMNWPIFTSLLLRSMLLVSFHAMLRPGEVSDSINILKIENISFQDNLLLIKFTNFKHHFGTPIRLFIKPTGDKFCPVSALRCYIFLRGSNPGPLFILPSGKPLSYSKYSQFFQLLVSKSNLNANITLHSLRIGAATHAALTGKPEPDIRRAGRWKGDSYKKYLRISSIIV